MADETRELEDALTGLTGSAEGADLALSQVLESATESDKALEQLPGVVERLGRVVSAAFGLEARRRHPGPAAVHARELAGNAPAKAEQQARPGPAFRPAAPGQPAPKQQEDSRQRQGWADFWLRSWSLFRGRFLEPMGRGLAAAMAVGGRLQQVPPPPAPGPAVTPTAPPTRAPAAAPRGQPAPLPPPAVPARSPAAAPPKQDQQQPQQASPRPATLGRPAKGESLAGVAAELRRIADAVSMGTRPGSFYVHDVHVERAVLSLKGLLGGGPGQGADGGPSPRPAGRGGGRAGAALEAARRAVDGLVFGLQGAVNALGQFGQRVAASVGQFDPSAAYRFQLALDDATAAVGKGMAPLLEEVTKSLGVMNRAVTSLSGALRPAFEQFGKVIFEAVTALSSALVPVVRALATALTPLLAVVRSVVKGLAPVLESVGDAVGSLVEALGPVLEDLGQTVGKVALEVAKALGEIVNAVKPLLSLVTDVLVPVLSALATVVRGLGEAISWVARRIGELFASPVDQQVREALIRAFEQRAAAEQDQGRRDELARAIEHLRSGGAMDEATIRRAMRGGRGEETRAAKRPQFMAPEEVARQAILSAMRGPDVPQQQLDVQRTTLQVMQNIWGWLRGAPNLFRGGPGAPNQPPPPQGGGGMFGWLGGFVPGGLAGG